jgi:hypothetical protein
LSTQNSFFNAVPIVNDQSYFQQGQGNIIFYPAYDAPAFSASRADILASFTVTSSSNSSHAGAISAYVGIYTVSGSTLSLASSGSQSYQWTNTSNNSYASLTGLRRISVPINVNYNGGDIYMAYMSLTTTSNANWFKASNLGVSWGNSDQIQGLLSNVGNTQPQFGQGAFSVSTAALPASVVASAIGGAGGIVTPIQFANVTA